MRVTQENIYEVMEESNFLEVLIFCEGERNAFEAGFAEGHAYRFVHARVSGVDALLASGRFSLEQACAVFEMDSKKYFEEKELVRETIAYPIAKKAKRYANRMQRPEVLKVFDKFIATAVSKKDLPKGLHVMLEEDFEKCWKENYLLGCQGGYLEGVRKGQRIAEKGVLSVFQAATVNLVVKYGFGLADAFKVFDASAIEVNRTIN
jgi:hypothetical protein